MMKLNIILCFLLYSLPILSQGQVSLEWAAWYNGPTNGNDAGLKITLDDSGYVYVIGSSPSIGTVPRDYLTIKYTPDGDSLWVRRYSGTELGVYVARDVAIDSAGNVYVTGTSDAATIKYDRFGNEQWVQGYEPSSRSQRLLLDSERNIVVAGESMGDYMILKYDTHGNLLWSAGYDGPANYTDRVSDMVLDSKDNIIVTGRSRGIDTDYDIATVKYSPNGDTLWVRRYNGPATSGSLADFGHAVTVDDSDNIYVTGWTNSVNNKPRCITIKYSPDGDSLWSHSYPSNGTTGYAGYDNIYDRGYIYVSARSNGHNDVLLKYDTGGNLIWTAVYVSNHPWSTNWPHLAVDKLGNIYMTSAGESQNGSDYIALKYDQDGNQMWEYLYRPGGTGYNDVFDIAVDNSFNIYLTGRAPGEGTGYDAVTLKLTQVITHAGETTEIPKAYELEQNFPNPFNPSTTIMFSLPIQTAVSLKVHDLLGQEVSTIVFGELPAGVHSYEWFANNLSSGVYFYRIQAGQFSQTKKFILLR